MFAIQFGALRRRTDGAQFFVRDDDRDMADCAPHAYPMTRYTARARGLALIISMEELPHGSERPGGKVDRELAEKVFAQLGFIVRSLVDKSATEISTGIEAARAEATGDCFVCLIMSHGNDGCFTAADGNRVQLREDVFSRFKASHCPALHGKPKIFFVDTCRGHDSMHFIANPDAEPEAEPAVDHGKAVPDEGDFLMSYSTLPGYVSWRSPALGSWFVSTLLDVIQKRHEQDDLETMINTTHKIVAEKTAKGGSGQAVEKVTKGLAGPIRWRGWRHERYFTIFCRLGSLLGEPSRGCSRIVTLEVKGGDTIENVKEKFHDKQGFPLDHFQLAFRRIYHPRDFVTMDERKTLSSYFSESDLDKGHDIHFKFTDKGYESHSKWEASAASSQ